MRLKFMRETLPKPLNRFLANVPNLYALKAPEKQRFSHVLRGCKEGYWLEMV